MKKITLLSLVAVLLTALTFTSCNTGDDNGYSYLTKEQQDAYQTNMAGSYSNLVLLFDHKNDANVKNQIDSVETECYFSMRNDSTFTISNLGMYGVEHFTAIINQPNAAILSVSSTKDTLVVRNGEAVIRPVMKVSLTSDHRIIDGLTAAKFMTDLKQLLENPLTLLI